MKLSQSLAQSYRFVKTQTLGSLGILEFTRHAQLNSFNEDLAKESISALDAFEKDPKVLSVLIHGGAPHGKAFSAGGDVKAIQSAILDRNFHNVLTQCRGEYSVINKVATLQHTKTIAFLHGIAMGTGAGLGINSSYTVASEKSVLAMPETAIGIVLDAGTSRHFANLSAPGLGMFLAMTGYRLRGADVYHSRLASHYIPTEYFSRLCERLSKAQKLEEISEILDQLHSPSDMKEFTLQPHLSTIQSVFQLGTVEEMRDSLSSYPSTWAKDQSKILAEMSPKALKLTKLYMEQSRDLSLYDNFILDYRLMTYLLPEHDFIEGIRAKLVDKDNSPHFNPATLEDVDMEKLSSYFEKIPSNRGTEFQLLVP